MGDAAVPAGLADLRRRAFLGTLAAAAALGPRRSVGVRDRPVPSPSQLDWQREELSLFLHFGINTFTDREWGDGSEDPAIFNPTNLDVRQWARAAKAAGFGSMILTAKHHDGFCLWPTRTTTHSVASSPWRGGSGDLVREFVDACRANSLGAGLYCSPWDRNHPTYGSDRYNDVYMEQLTELLGISGRLVEVWFDGANGEGPRGRRQVYDWPRTFALVRRRQAGAVIFSDAGPDVRWIGIERGVAGETCWSTINPDSVPYPGYDAPGVGELLQRGDPDGSVWRPGETDVSIRPGWFWHPAEDGRVRSAENLLELYATSVGRNSKLLLNVPPTRDGLLHDADLTALSRFRAARERIYGTDLMGSVRATGERTGTRMTLAFPRPIAFNTAVISEDIERGQLFSRYEISTRDRVIARGTTIGHKKIDRFDWVTTNWLQVRVTSSYGNSRLLDLSVHAA